MALGVSGRRLRLRKKIHKKIIGGWRRQRAANAPSFPIRCAHDNAGTQSSGVLQRRR